MRLNHHIYQGNVIGVTDSQTFVKPLTWYVQYYCLVNCSTVEFAAIFSDG